VARGCSGMAAKAIDGFRETVVTAIEMEQPIGMLDSVTLPAEDEPCRLRHDRLEDSTVLVLYRTCAAQKEWGMCAFAN